MGMNKTRTIETEKGHVLITTVRSGKKRITVSPKKNVFIPIKVCETDYPIALIELILQIKGADYLCDEICRDVDPNYVMADLENDLKAYFIPQELDNKRILDFGCGSGASSMILSRMFPLSEVVGVDLDETYLQIARMRLEHYGYDNVSFFSSPSGNELPANIGEFDLLIMSAVYEHLLPEERRAVIPLVWSKLTPGGGLFLNMTPHRWFPIEHHTTGLPLLNYMPQRLAFSFAKAFSGRINKSEPWEMLLRRGIRGGTEYEILSLLPKAEGKSLMEPVRDGLNDRIDLWFSRLNKERYLGIKKAMNKGLKVLRALTGVTLVPNLSLVIKKGN